MMRGSPIPIRTVGLGMIASAAFAMFIAGNFVPYQILMIPVRNISIEIKDVRCNGYNDGLLTVINPDQFILMSMAAASKC